MRISWIFLMSFLLSGCAIGPLVSHETARTVGKSNHELIGGYGSAGYVLKWNVGLTENLDFGVHWEFLSIGIRAKYALVNGNNNGLSLAIAGGIGESIGGSHYYGDLMASYLSGKWEPYGTLRVVHVKNDPVEFRDKDTGPWIFALTRLNMTTAKLSWGAVFGSVPIGYYQSKRAPCSHSVRIYGLGAMFLSVQRLVTASISRNLVRAKI